MQEYSRILIEEYCMEPRKKEPNPVPFVTLIVMDW